MTTATFNTLKFVRRLTDAGIPREHAEAEAEADALSEVLEVNLKDLATKSDLRELELRITIKLGTIVAVAIGAVAAIVKLL